MTAPLVKLCDGMWINPASVNSVVAHDGWTVGDKTVPPKVCMDAAGRVFTWEYDSLDTAKAAAGKFAGLCNASSGEVGS